MMINTIKKIVLYLEINNTKPIFKYYANIMIMNLIIINRIINTECKGGSEFYKNVNVTIDFIT